jgi:peptide/nickel transport system permease protein
VLLSVLHRMAVLVASLLVASLLVFVVLAVFPGDPARVALGVNASEAAVRSLREQFGLDRPLLVQYLDWLGGLARGDLGTSYISKAPIGPQVADRVQVTGILVVTSMLVALVLALPAGFVMAVRHRRLSGLLLSALSQVGVAVPAFLAGIAMIMLFAVRLGWLPANGWTPPAADPVQFLRQLALPALSLGLVQGAVLTRYVRSAVLDVLHEDYLRTARAKGLTRGRALARHGLRNAAVPILTVLGLQLATLLVGAVVVERVFVIPGIGSLLLDSVADRDLLAVRDVVMVLVAAVLAVNVVVDLLYAVVDPRLRRAAR